MNYYYSLVALSAAAAPAGGSWSTNVYETVPESIRILYILNPCLFAFRPPLIAVSKAFRPKANRSFDAGRSGMINSVGVFVCVFYLLLQILLSLYNREWSAAFAHHTHPMVTLVLPL